MNHLHLQETAKHYASLAEEAQKNLEQEKELNEDLLTIIDALCEELGIDVEELGIDEGTRRTARLSYAVAKAQENGEKVGPRSPLAQALSTAREKYQRSERKRELKPGAIENRMKWQKKYPGSSQPRGFGSYGF
jgi:hypothetical protein